MPEPPDAELPDAPTANTYSPDADTEPSGLETAEAETDFAVFSCADDSRFIAEYELRALIPDLPAFLWLDASADGEPVGAALAALPVPFDECAAAIERARPIFLRHLAPVQRTVPLSGTESDITVLREAVAELAPRVTAEFTASVQTRVLGDAPRPYNRAAVNRALWEELTERTGVTLDTRAPEQTLSVCVAADTAFLGVSWTRQNRSDWAGGERRFKRDEKQISRAEFKLLEAFEVFGITPPPDGLALDVGAAPGGWTRVLREKGLHVVAVDPAELDPRLERDPYVNHVWYPIQHYGPTDMFDIIVNDLKMDARDSIDVLLRLRPTLKPGGTAIMTLKLPKHGETARSLLGYVRDDLARLQTGYRLIGARQLFHNRSEITVALGA